MRFARGDLIDLRYVDRQIDDCHRQIEAQCQRLVQQTHAGHAPDQSRLVLLLSD